MAVVKATVNLIFDPPPPGAPSPPSSSQNTPTVTTPPSSSSPARSSSSSSASNAAYYAGYPETFYLDYGRFGTLNTDAADFTALYMLLMMYRQLVHSPLSRRGGHAHARTDALSPDALVRLKKEIWEIGPAHPGLCFMQGRRPGSCSLGSSRSAARQERAERDREAEMRRWRAEIEDVALQVAMHASEPRGSLSAAKAAVAEERERRLHAPDMQVVKFALGWTETNLRQGSPFSVLCKRRLRERVEEAVLAIVLPQHFASQSLAGAPSSSAPSTPTPSLGEPKDALVPQPTSSGLEPLGAEVKHLSQRAAKLVEIHMNVYGELYAHPAFLDKDVLPNEAPSSASAHEPQAQS
ncbi:hypothetical protein BV20DRAFT_100118 [Pilatotrama ljubarskyi]|nr:hypothetical protein BV20DRAFT_100118 [Pilatotrama ljubarskyi]